MKAWKWKDIHKTEDGNWPRERTDHSAVLWQSEDDKEYMVVYGGSMEDQGACSELWMLDCNKWTWEEIEIQGPSPNPRSSHAGC
jgi:hypothetical protein